jgi:NAD(P)-dependent dehydrogenase (short-subunit alcohol dehydrogenase family)
MTLVATSKLFDLSGKVALVTGGARGIGQAIALRLADAGAGIIVCDILEERAQDTARHIVSAAGRAQAIVADLSKQDDIDRLVKESVAALGGIDILVNNAALRGWATWDTLTAQDWDRFMAVNQKAVFFLSQAVAHQMIAQNRGGAIVNIASTAAIHPVRWKVDYNTAKAGVAMMTKSLAMELGKHMIRVNAVGPGGTRTPGGSGAPTPQGFDPDMLRKMGEEWHARMAMPVGLLDPDDIARTVLFLSCDASRHVTGQVVFVDGGYLLG